MSRPFVEACELQGLANVGRGHDPELDASNILTTQRLASMPRRAHNDSPPLRAVRVKLGSVGASLTCLRGPCRAQAPGKRRACRAWMRACPLPSGRMSMAHPATNPDGEHATRRQLVAGRVPLPGPPPSQRSVRTPAGVEPHAARTDRHGSVGRSQAASAGAQRSRGPRLRSDSHRRTSAPRSAAGSSVQRQSRVQPLSLALPLTATASGVAVVVCG